MNVRKFQRNMTARIQKLRKIRNGVKLFRQISRKNNWKRCPVGNSVASSFLDPKNSRLISENSSIYVKGLRTLCQNPVLGIKQAANTRHICLKKFGDILQNMNFSRYYRNRGKFIYGFDPNIINIEDIAFSFLLSCHALLKLTTPLLFAFCFCFLFRFCR